MIRRPYHDGWILISQRDHAALSGALMARWGNEAFASLAPSADVLLGVADHDNGWDAWDRAPEIDSETGFPLQFTELTSEAYSTIWRCGVERHRKESPYAALLIAMHTEDLARRRVERVSGLEGSRAGDPFFAEEVARLRTFIAEMETLRAELTDAVSARSGARCDQFEAEIRADFRLLQIGDLISLELCCGLLGPFHVDQVPARALVPFRSVTFDPAGGNTVTVAPYPFSNTEVVVAVSGRILRKKAFASNAELQEHLLEADPLELPFRLRPA